MKSDAKSQTATQPDVRRTKWQLVAALVIAAAVMAVTMKSCPADIRVRTTDALQASL